MSRSSTDKERVVSLCIGVFYVWIGLFSTGNPWVGVYALVYVIVSCWLIWYPNHISRMRFMPRFTTHLRIPALYVRYLGWVMLLGLAAVTIAATVTMPFIQH